MKQSIVGWLSLMLVLTVIGAFAAGPTAPPVKGKALYDRLGGKDAIKAVVDEFIKNVSADKRINSRFAKADIPKLKRNLIDQICQASGGPCTYTGRNMKDVHAGMGIAGKEFDAVVEDLVKALGKLKVGKKEKDELLGTLGPMKPDIVEKQ